MSSIIYNKAFEVALMHDYYVYTDAPVNNEFSVNRNMAIMPTKECEQLMKKGRMRFVPTLKGFTTFFQSYIDGTNTELPFVKLSDGDEFVFALYLNVTSINLFLNVSDLNVGSKTYGAGKFFMLNALVNNLTGPPPATLPLTPTLANSLRGPIFGYSFKPSQVYAGGADIIIKYESLSGPTVLTFIDVKMNLVSQTYDIEIDLSDEVKGFYVLEAYITGSTNPLDLLNENDFYVDGDLVNQNVFGIMRMKYADINKLYTTIGASQDLYTFDYTFNVRETKWRYYVVVENLDATFFTANSLQIKDESGGGIIFKASEPPPAFTLQLGKPDPDIAVNGLRTVIFDAQTDIAFKEKPIKNINLFQQPADEKMVSNLPNANPEGVDSDQYNPAQTPPLTPAQNISEIYVYI